MEKSKQQVINCIDNYEKELTALSDAIWSHPELSLQEFYATETYVTFLREHGFEVEENYGGIATSFVGKYGHGRPYIGFLAEYDALSGMSQERCMTEERPIIPGGAGHGCGHNMLGAGDMGAALAVKDYLVRTGCPGTVFLFGCPGEEGGAGKAFLARDNMWRDLDAALTWHPSDCNEVVTGTNNSSIQVLYEFEGIAAHAAGDPHNGRSALDGVELMNIGVQFLREHMTDDCRVHYSILDAGGISPNVVQAHASVLYLVRANKVKDSLKLLARVDKIAEGAAMMTETKVKRIFIDGTAELVPNFVLEELLYKNFEALGVPTYTPQEEAFAAQIKKTCPNEIPGAEHNATPELYAFAAEMSQNGTKPLNDFLMPLHHSTSFHPGSSDVGDVAWQTPTAQIHVVTFVSGAPGHSWQNVSTGGSSIGNKGFLHAGKVLAMTAVDLLENPGELEQARREFEQRSAEGYVCPIEKDAVPRAV